MSRLSLEPEVLARLDAILSAPAGRRIGVLGLGVVGTAMARHLVRRGATVIGADARAEIELHDLRMETRLGPMGADTFADVEALAITPGADPRQAAVRALLDSGRPVFGELELAGRLPARIAAITGTNGKSTTTALLGALVAASGQRTFVGGNLGDPIITWLDSGEPADVAVLELSSFQLESAYRFSADVGVVLNITPDHFERYADVDSYAHAKQCLVEQSTSVVLNYDDERVRAMASVARKAIYWFSTRAATLEGDGAVIEGDQVRAAGALSDLTGFDLAHPRLFGRHNRENALAALVAAHALGVVSPATRSAVLRAYRAFAGLEHRLEWVGEKAGVLYVNDSKATNDASAAVAVAAFDRPVVLLAGGRDKGTGYAALVAAARARVHAVIAYGEAGSLIAEAFAEQPGKVIRADSLAEAFAGAVQVARPGDAVVLAPACSSFDEFNNYVERGRAFKRLFAELDR